MNSVGEKQTHAINLSMRREMTISGVTEVKSFDDLEVVLECCCGELTVEGRDIKIGTLDTERGIVALEGQVDALFYSTDEESRGRGFFGKLKK